MINLEEIRPVWAEINLDNIAHNIQEVKRVSKKDCIITAVIKANGYGHGAVDIAETLLQNGANRLAVATLDEALELRTKDINCDILILGYTGSSRADKVITYDLDQCVYSFEIAEALSLEAKKQNKIAKIHIKLDTGMGRIGYKPNTDSVNEVIKISKLENLELTGIFTHFSTADEISKEYTNEQYNKFIWFCNELKSNNVIIKIQHCANSATIIDMKNMHEDMVRAGIILYGLTPSKDVNFGSIDLRPAMSLIAKISHIKTLESGDYVSYARKFQATQEVRVASIPIGYADGYTRLLSNKAHVLVNGIKCPIIGNICMDQCMIDISHAGEVVVNDEVTLFGYDQNNNLLPVDELADLIGTINYEMVCMISRRVPRVYKKNNKVVKIVNYL